MGQTKLSDEKNVVQMGQTKLPQKKNYSSES